MMRSRSTAGGQAPSPDLHVHSRGLTQLRWFLSSKEPNSTEEYRLLPGSLDPGLESAFVETGATSTLSLHQRGHEGEEQSVTFSGGGEQAQVLAIISTGRSDIRDGSGRAINPTRGLYADWRSCASDSIGYESLYAAFSSLGWISPTAGPPRQHEGTVALPVPTTDWVQVADRVAQEMRMQWCAEIAGGLLDGKRVAVIPDRTGLSCVDRIRILDAIMALLPYGARNAVKVSTWVASSTRHRIDLCFSDGVGDGQVSVGFGQQPSLVTYRSTGCCYRDRLYELMRDGKSLAEVVAHLASERAPWLAVDGSEALESLGVLQYPKKVYGEILSGEASVDRVCAVLTGPDQTYPNEFRAAYVRYLAIAGCANTEDGRTAKNTLRGEWSVGIARYLGDLVRAGVWEEAPPAAPTWLDWARTESAKLPTSYETYVAAAFALPEITPTGIEFERMVTLACDVLSSDTHVGDWIGQVLGAQPCVLAKALSLVKWEERQRGRITWKRRSNGTTTSLDRVLAAASSSSPTYVRAVLAVLSGKSVSEADLDDLTRRGPETVVTAIIAGAHRRRDGSAFDRLLPALAGLFDEKSLSGIEVLAIEQLVALPPRLLGRTEASRAKLDVLAIKAGCRPPSLNATTASSDDYLSSLQLAWEHFIPTPNRCHSAQLMVKTLLAEELDQGSIVALNRVASVIQGSFVDDTVHLVAERIEQDRAQCAVITFPPRWTNPLTQMPGFTWFKALCELEGQATGTADGSKVVDAVRVAIGALCTEREVLHRLAAYLGAAEPASIDDMLMRLGEDNEMRKIRTGIRDALLSGRCGERASRRFREYVDIKRRWYEWCSSAG